MQMCILCRSGLGALELFSMGLKVEFPASFFAGLTCIFQPVLEVLVEEIYSIPFSRECDYLCCRRPEHTSPARCPTLVQSSPLSAWMSTLSSRSASSQSAPLLFHNISCPKCIVTALQIPLAQKELWRSFQTGSMLGTCGSFIVSLHLVH